MNSDITPPVHRDHSGAPTSDTFATAEAGDSARKSEFVVRNRYILLMDLPLIAVAAFGAFALRFDWLFLHYRPEFTVYLIAAIVLKPLIFFPFGMYARYWRYGTAQDVVAIGLAASASAVGMAIFVGAGLATGFLPWFARPILLIDWLLTLALTGGLRMSVRIIGDAQQTSRKPLASRRVKRVLIAGAGEAGNLVVRELYKNPQLGLQAVCFLDDAAGKWKKQILGIPVRGPLASLEDVVKHEAVDEVIIAMPTASGGVVRRAAEACGRAGIKPRIVPGVFELLDGHVSISRLRTVEISDLLRRPQVVGRAERLPYLEGRSVLVTGAGGSIGSELSRQVAFSGPRHLVLFGHGENSIFSVHGKLRDEYPGVEIHPMIGDIRDRVRLESIFARFKPEVVFHAAAHKHVPLMEANPEEAFTNNVRGTQNLLDASDRWGVYRFVLVSTDKAVAPSSMMGASKRLAELLVVGAGARTDRPYVVVRFGNVLGSRGSVVPMLQGQIERGGPITITHPDMKRFFMTIPEAVQLVLQAGGMGAAGDLFVLNMGEQLRVLDLARDLIQLSGIDPAVIPVHFTGVRPGEKLEEALWGHAAAVEVTSNKDVLRVRECDVPAGLDIAPVIENVVAAAESGDIERLQRALAVALPSYAASASCRAVAQEGL
jgi:FlaA1/EpsC-like NDP-sugar epimerase